MQCTCVKASASVSPFIYSGFSINLSAYTLYRYWVSLILLYSAWVNSGSNICIYKTGNINTLDENIANIGHVYLNFYYCF